MDETFIYECYWDNSQISIQKHSSESNFIITNGDEGLVYPISFDLRKPNSYIGVVEARNTNSAYNIFDKAVHEFIDSNNDDRPYKDPSLNKAYDAQLWAIMKPKINTLEHGGGAISHDTIEAVLDSEAD